MTTRIGLRFLELVTFDDVRTDWFVFDPVSGKPCELWLLVARDQATAMILGFVMHPSIVREDGSTSHLGLREMKQLAAWLLERYPLPPYTSHWRVERGTATLPAAVAQAMAEMLPSRIQLHYTSMIGGKSPAGYREKAKGNSRGKASHESHNRLIHTQTAYIAGQTGSRWDIRPADLQARADECVETWAIAQSLPAHLRGQERYPLLLPEQAREHLFRICIDQNFRTDHKLEGFDRILEWFDPTSGKWMPQSTWPGSTTLQTRTRMEMPVERAIKLMAPYAGQWTKTSADIITILLSHTIRHVTVEPSGEVSFSHEGSPLRFSPPQIDLVAIRQLLPTNQKALAYFHPDDPSFLHITNGRGSIIGTWYRRARLSHQDTELLAQAMRYTAAALKTAQEYAATLAAPDRAELASIRAHNADLVDRGSDFHQVATIPESAQVPDINSPVASALLTSRAAVKAAEKQTKKDIRDTRDLLRKAAAQF